MENLFYVQGMRSTGKHSSTRPGSPSFGGYFQPGNLQDSWGWSVTPTLNRDFGYVTLLARYTYGEVNFEESRRLQCAGLDHQVGVRLAGHVRPARADHLAPVPPVRPSLQHENFLPYRYDQAGADLGYAINSDLRLVGEYGLETDLTETATDGGLDSSYWMAGLPCTSPTSAISLEARVGERFWGRQLLLQLPAYRARYLEVDGPLRARRRARMPTQDGVSVPPDGLPPGELPGSLRTSPISTTNASNRFCSSRHTCRLRPSVS